MDELAEFPVADHERRVEQLEKLAHSLDSQLKIPGTSFSLGWDSIIGLIPGIGDTVMLGVSSLYPIQAWRMGVKKRHLFKMTGNIFIDWLIGLIPILGDFLDMGWKANVRNAEILRAAHEQQKRDMGTTHL